jgi:hypothetical protein
MVGVGVDSRLQLHSALKARVIRVPARDDGLDRLQHLTVLLWRVSRQLTVSERLKTTKKLVLLWCFNVVNNAKQDAKRPIAPPLAYKLSLVSKLALIILVGVLILAPEEPLADEIKRVRSATVAAIRRAEAKLLTNCCNG